MELKSIRLDSTEHEEAERNATHRNENPSPNFRLKPFATRTMISLFQYPFSAQAIWLDFSLFHFDFDASFISFISLFRNFHIPKNLPLKL